MMKVICNKSIINKNMKRQSNIEELLYKFLDQKI